MSGLDRSKSSAPLGFYNRQLNPLLWVSDDKKEAHFLTPDMPGPRCSKWSYTYIDLRPLQFTDGVRLVGWCSDRGCVSCQPISAVAEGTSRLAYKSSLWEHSRCGRVQKVVVGVQGQSGLAYLLEAPQPSSSKPDGAFYRQLDLGWKKHVFCCEGWVGD